jgi:uroporphyrinogen decarboxylase
MNPKERVLATIGHEEPDRVPMDYSGNPGITRRLEEHFGTSDVRDALGVDFRHLFPSYEGPELHEDKGEVKVDNWGIHRRWVEHESGGYWDYCEWPLRDASVEEIESWPLPDPEDYDYSEIAAHCAELEKFCVVTGGPGWPDVINGSGMLRTMDQVLVDLITDNEAGLRLADRRLEIQLEVGRRTLEAAEGGIDLLYLGEDLGTQRGPTIGLDLFRRHIRPRVQKLVDLAKAYDVPTMFHSCGSSSWAFEDLIEMGIDVVDTLQPEAAGMEPARLKADFGDRLAFHGCISTAGPLAYGTEEEVRASVRETLEVMMPGGGYILAPTHQIQDNTPTGNALAMYEVGREYGVYR